MPAGPDGAPYLAGTTDLVAAVTVFQPDGPSLRRLVAGLRESGLAVLLHIDGPEALTTDATLRADLASDPAVTLLESADNVGIGAALNRLAFAAREAGYACLLYFDQDSEPSADLPSALCEAFARASTLAPPVAVVGPMPVAAAGAATQPPRYRRRKARVAVEGLQAVDFVITSGSLIPLAALSVVGPFREDYFIDAIDTEWCFRARSLGFSVFAATGATMPHRVGQGVLRFGPLSFPRQSETRMATYIRNQAHGLRLAHVPLRWKLRTLVYLPLQAALFLAIGDRRRGSAGRLWRAVRDGLAGRLGKPA